MASSPSKRMRTSSPSRSAGTMSTHPKSASSTSSTSITSTSPYIPMFQHFRSELDTHHDRRERIIKASRDVTANSKKIIFTLQRTPSLGSSLPNSITADVTSKSDTISSLLKSIYPNDLAGLNSWRYHWQVSPGMQELMEAAVFRHYLTTGGLLSFTDARKLVEQLVGVDSAGADLLTEEDYLLGVFDAVGEMMRWSVGHLAVSRGRGEGDDLLVKDLRSLRLALEMLRTHGAGCERDVERKMEVMQTCVNKVENTVYGLVVRGSERPKEWIPEDTVPDTREGRGD